MDASHTIPKEFQDELRFVEAKDSRTDNEILDSLTKHVPVTSEKNIWSYWHSGIHSMPGWCQRNIVNWIRLNDGWTLRILDHVPDSPNNALKWFDADMLPETFVKKTMDGHYTGPHSADFLRGVALYQYGGVWMDVGIILIRDLDRICWRQLQDPASPLTISVPWMFGTHMANHFVASRKGDPFIKRWHDLFIHLWKNQKNCDHIIENPLVQFGKAVKFEDSAARGFKWDFAQTPQMVMGYIGQVLSWDRLCMLEDPHDGFNGRSYYAEKVLLFDSLTEDWSAEDTVGFAGQDLFDVLATKLDADPASKEYQLAYKAIWRMLTKASMQKITHGKNLTKTPALGVLWDLKENEGKDIEPGTFASLLRYGSVHFEQLRESIDYVAAEKPENVIARGLLEA
jgi:hypothetical protein